MSALSFATIDYLTRSKLGMFDAACPVCGPDCRLPQNRARKVLRIWSEEPGFATYHCARCNASGWAREDGGRTVDLAHVTKLRSATAKRDAHHAKRQGQKALALWRAGMPPQGTLVEAYLAARGIHCPIPPTIRFLPPRKRDWKPAMMAAFGMADEPEPGELRMRDGSVRGVHLTLLAPDGRGKAGTDCDKFTIGRSLRFPIVLAPMNDLLGLSISEGIEDGLSLAESTGLGVWAAGAAGRMPALADAVPAYADCVTIASHADPAGRKGAAELTRRLTTRGIHVEALSVPARDREVA